MCSIVNLQGLIRLQKKHKGKKVLLRERKVERNKEKGRKNERKKERKKDEKKENKGK
jgi:hypothetical protein